MSKELDLGNYQMVGIQAGNIGVAFPTHKLMTPDEALVHAAWIVALAEPNSEHKFEDVLKKVKST